MRKIISICFTALSFSLAAQDQEQILPVSETPRDMSKGTQPSFLIEIPQTTLKDVEKDWLKYVSAGSKGKATSVNGENLQPAAVVKNVSANPLNIYSRLVEIPNAVRVTVWLTENDSVFISQTLNNDQDLAAHKYVRDFAVQEYQQAVKSELKNEQDKLKDLQKQFDDYTKAEDKSTLKIGADQRAIQRANTDIATANTDIQNVSAKISDQKTMVDNTASDPNANKGAKQTLKDLENQKNKSQKQVESLGKNIDKWNAEIRAEQRNVDDAKAAQTQKQTEIDAQKQKIAGVQAKLDGIK